MSVDTIMPKTGRLHGASVPGTPDDTFSNSANTMSGAAQEPSIFLEQGENGPLTWVGSNDAPGNGHQITWSIAELNYADDKNVATFSDPFPQQFVPLVQKAMAVWESVADVRLTELPDTQSAQPQRPDIRLGVSDLGTTSQSPTIGDTYRHFVNDKFQPDVLVTIEDPKLTNVQALSNGDYQYSGFQATVLQDLIHEIGHALGLGHNPTDPNSIMSPVLTSANRLPDAQDVAALQSLYGPPETSAAYALLART